MQELILSKFSVPDEILNEFQITNYSDNHIEISKQGLTIVLYKWI